MSDDRRTLVGRTCDGEVSPGVTTAVTAAEQKGAVALRHVAVATDHSFSDHRIALQTIVVEWLEKLKKYTPADKH